jgi:ATP-binding cassette, subfamily C (CFTR/MRP), member 1
MRLFAASRAGKRKLLFAILRTLKWPILVPVIPRLILIGFTLCQPLLVKRFLDYLRDSAKEQDANIGYGLIGAYGLVYFGMAVSILQRKISSNLH